MCVPPIAILFTTRISNVAGNCVYCSSMASDHLFVISFFVYQIYRLCRPQVKWWVTTPTMLSVLAGNGLAMGLSFSSIATYIPSDQEAAGVIM
ncbi:hypothetical protein EDD16DRAFT_1680168, partial [Pisolithus croceorrhizus]